MNQGLDEGDFIEQEISKLNNFFFIIEKNGNIHWWNNYTCEITGYTDNQISHMNIKDFFPETERERISKKIQKVLSNGEIIIESELITSNGENIPYKFTGTQLTDGKETLIALTGKSIDTQKETYKNSSTENEKVRDLKERDDLKFFKKIVENLRVGLGVYNRKGEIEYVNKAYADIFNLDREKIEGKFIWEINPELKENLFDQYWQSFEEKETKTSLAYHEIEDKRLPVKTVTTRKEIDGKTYHLGMAKEITEYERLEEYLQRQEILQELHRITSDPKLSLDKKVEKLLSLGCKRFDLEYGFLTEISDGIQTISKAVGDHDLIQEGETCPLSKAYCRKTIETDDGWLAVQNAPSEGWSGDAAYEKFDLGSYIGAKVLVESDLYGTLCFASTEPRAEPFSESERVFVEIMAQWVSYEIERQITTEELHRKNERLEEFASVVSHDLRNPLNVAKIELETLQKEYESESIDRIATAHERIQTLIDDLLKLARGGKKVSETEQIDLSELINQCWKNVDTKKATLVNNTEITVQADRSRFQQLLENLFKNAVEHGGSDVKIEVGDLDNNDGFYISDDGPGISEEKREEIFKSGYSTSDKGTGFGLSIVKDIVEAHDWDIRVESSESGGACFEIYTD